MKISPGVFFLLFFICLAFDFAFVQFGYPTARYFTKPLLVPLLLLAFWSEVRSFGLFGKLLIGALFFSWMGDVLLMFDSDRDIFFIVGLVCFLTAHLFYIQYFLKTDSVQPSYFKKRPLPLSVIAIYSVGLLYMLWPGLGALKLPVILYATVISCMLAAAFWQYGKLPKQIALYFIIGASLFVASDSMLAINKFRNKFILADQLIMLTYALAQFCLVKGAVNYELRARTDEVH